MTKKKSKISRSKKSVPYFTQVHEDAIVAYTQSDCNVERTRLYVDFINPVFNELIEKMVYTYRFSNLPNISDLIEECKYYLVSVLAKFDPTRGHKAFSYFSVITKNFFIHKAKANTRKLKKEISHEDITKLADQNRLSEGNRFLELSEKSEFMEELKKEVVSWLDLPKLKKNEHLVCEAVIILLNNIDEIEILKKKAIYLYLRELTKLNTKQLAAGLKPLKVKFFQWKKKWIAGKV